MRASVDQNLGNQCSPRVFLAKRSECDMVSKLSSLMHWDVPRCLDRVLGCPAGGGSSWEGLAGQTKLGELFSVAFGYNDTGQSDYP